VTVVACEGWMDGSLMRVEKVSPSTVSRVWKVPQRFHCHGLSCPCCIKLSRCCVSQCWDFAYTATFAGPNLVCNLSDYLKVILPFILAALHPWLKGCLLLRVGNVCRPRRPSVDAQCPVQYSISTRSFLLARKKICVY